MKLRFPDGEIEFVASAALTSDPTIVETLFGRQVMVETSTEIVAKKLWHRDDFAALEVLDYRRSYDECIRLVSEALT